MNTKEEVFYLQVTDLWKKFCKEHALLLDYTFDEYAFLLGSEIEKLEENLKKKIETVQRIANLEQVRRKIINKMNTQLKRDKIFHVKDLLKAFGQYHLEKKHSHLFKHNALLEDLINKIKEQNKKNQLFINKAFLSLKEIREDALKEKNYSTYNAKGTEKQKSISSKT